MTFAICATYHSILVLVSLSISHFLPQKSVRFHITKSPAQLQLHFHSSTVSFICSVQDIISSSSFCKYIISHHTSKCNKKMSIWLCGNLVKQHQVQCKLDRSHSSVSIETEYHLTLWYSVNILLSHLSEFSFLNLMRIHGCITMLNWEH